MSAFIKTFLLEAGDEIDLDQANVVKLANWLQLHSGLDSKTALALLKEAALAENQPLARKSSYRGVHQRRRFKKNALLAVLAILASTPFFTATFPGLSSWQQLITWLAGFLGINVVQLVGLFTTLFEISELELSHDEESVVQTIVSVPQRAEDIRRQIKARFPRFTDRELDNIFERLTSHGFLLGGRDAKGKLTYRLNLKWKKTTPEH
jgi:hypothetical protein